MRTTLQSVAFVGMGLCLGLAFCEVIVRVLFPASINRFIYDPKLGFARPPSAHGYYETAEFSTSVVFNSDGLNSDPWEVPPGAPAQDCRVLLLGDSMLEAIQVMRESNFVTLLNRTGESDNTRRLRVMNAGVSSYGTTQEMLLGKQLLSQYSFDVVGVLFLSSNDIRNNSRELEEPDVQTSYLTRPYIDTAADRTSIVGPGDSTHSPIANPPWRAKLLRSSRLVSFLHDRVSRSDVSRRWLVQLGILSQSSEGTTTYPRDLDVYLNNSGQVWDDAWVATAESIRLLQQTSNQHSATFAMFVAPSPELVDVSRWNRLLEYYPDFSQRNPDPTIPTTRLSRITHELQVPLVDLESQLRRSAGADKFHFKDDGHLTTAGHVAVHDALRPELTRLCERAVARR